MAFTVAKEFQPSIIYMDEINQVFGNTKKKDQLLHNGLNSKNHYKTSKKPNI